jgi:hypothetical protein
LSQAEQDKLAEQYACRAVELLRKAQAAGVFKDAGTVEHLKTDTKLQSLRSRQEFQKLLTDLEAKPPI